MRLLWSEVECWRYYVSECVCIQWNLCNQDTNGAEESVIVSEVSSFQRYILGVGKGVFILNEGEYRDGKL